MGKSKPKGNDSQSRQWLKVNQRAMIAKTINGYK
jgi:hypothetical protein